MQRRWGLSQMSIRTCQSNGLESITYIRKGRVVYDRLVSLVGSPAGLYSYGNFITYTEYDAKPPEYIIKENDKPGLNRGTHRIVVGSNGNIYYSPDHYLTFVRLVD